MGKWYFSRNLNNRRTVINPAHQIFFGLIEMTFGLVHASYSLPEWQAVKLTFFAPWESKTIVDYLTVITMYLFALNLIFCGEKEKKNLNRLSRLLNKNLSRIFICFVLSIWALFSIDRFHPRHGQLQCQFTGTKESVYILKKTVKLAQHILGTLTWPSFHCFGTPIWPPWRHVKTLYSLQDCCKQLSHHFQCTLIYCDLNVNLPFN